MAALTLSYNVFKEVLEANGFSVVTFFDSVHFGLDSACNLEPIKSLQEKYNTQDKDKIKLTPYSLLKRVSINTKLELEYPELALLKKLDSVISGDYLINEVEFALDICSAHNERIIRLRKFIDDHLLYRTKEKKQFCYHHFRALNDTDYFANRILRGGSLIVYSRRPSKMAELPCVHIEMRLRNSKDLKAIGIYSLKELISFCPETFWNKRLDLRALKLNQLGQLVDPIKTGLSSSSYLRRGQKQYAEFHSAQHLLSHYPQYATAYVPITSRRMFESRLKTALEE